MCGIAGIVAKKPMTTEVVDKFFSASRQIKHRGPDGFHHFMSSDRRILTVHYRLAIQDLSLAGQQPMTSRSGSKVMVFNGEIYNHFDVRKELATQFDCRSDARTLVEAFDQYRRNDVFARIDGMYALAIFDLNVGTLLLARDSNGEKPLFYHENAEFILFSSELSVIVNFLEYPSNFSELATQLFYALGYIPSPYTIYSDIRKMCPGESRYYDISGNLELLDTTFNSANELVNSERIRALDLDDIDAQLKRAVESRLLSDRDIGVFMSSGIDSTLVAWYAGKILGSKLQTFTLDNGTSTSEFALASQIAAKIGSTHHRVSLTPQLLERHGLVAMTQMGEPFADSSIVLTNILSEFAKDHVAVVLGGDGADETFGGYKRYLAAAKIELFNNIFMSAGGLRKSSEAFASKIALLLTSVPVLRNNAAFRRVFEISFAIRNKDPWRFYLAATGGSLDPAIYDVPDEFFEIVAHLANSSRITELMNMDRRFFLADCVLQKSDRSSMRHGIEQRSPFLNPALTLHAQSPWPVQSKNRFRSKPMLRTLHSQKFGSSVHLGPKRGFEAPKQVMRQILRSDWANFIHNHEPLTQLHESAQTRLKVVVKADYPGQSLTSQTWRDFTYCAWLVSARCSGRL